MPARCEAVHGWCPPRPRTELLGDWNKWGGLKNSQEFNGGVGIIRIILIFIPLAITDCPLLNVMAFRFWFTFGTNYKLTSSKFRKINK